MTAGRIDAVIRPARAGERGGSRAHAPHPARHAAARASAPRAACRALTAASLAAALLLGACGNSPPVRYHALSAVPAPAGSRVAYDGPVIEVGSVQLPPALTRPELVRDTAAGRFEIREFDHWAAPLSRLARQTLAEDLEARLPVGKVVYPGASWPVPGAVLEVDVLSFRVDAGTGTLVLSWSLRQRAAPGDASTTLRGAQLRLETPVADGGGPAATPRAWSDLLRQLSERVIADISRSAPG